jgi:16S rRNA C1402 N4-methylase RsmH
MLFANPNRKFSSLFDEMFDMEVDNTLTLSNHQVIKELEND